MEGNLFIFNFNTMKKEYRKFINSIVLFLIVIVSFDMIFGDLARYAFFSQKSGKNYRITYSLDKTEDSILIFGSSHAVYHYIPKIFDVFVI